jgi:hypothetical protein
MVLCNRNNSTDNLDLLPIITKITDNSAMRGANTAALGIVAVLIGGITCLAQQLPEPTHATICQIYAQPDAFDGQIVTIRARLGAAWIPAYLQNEAGVCVVDGKRIDRMIFVTTPEQVSSAAERPVGGNEAEPPTAQFELIKDEEYVRLTSLALSEANRNNTGKVVAWFTGRIDYCKHFKAYDHGLAGNGFGHRGETEIELVLKSVSKVELEFIDWSGINYAQPVASALPDHIPEKP